MRSLARDFPIIDYEDGSRAVQLPDGRLLDVDFERIHEMASNGMLLECSDEYQQFVRYLLGGVDD